MSGYLKVTSGFNSRSWQIEQMLTFIKVDLGDAIVRFVLLIRGVRADRKSVCMSLD